MSPSNTPHSIRCLFSLTPLPLHHNSPMTPLPPSDVSPSYTLPLSDASSLLHPSLPWYLVSLTSSPKTRINASPVLMAPLQSPDWAAWADNQCFITSGAGVWDRVLQGQGSPTGQCCRGCSRIPVRANIFTGFY